MEIKHNEQMHLFEIQDNGKTAVVEYKPFDGGINIVHTFVPKPLQSKGYGSALVKQALDYGDYQYANSKIKLPRDCFAETIFLKR